MDIGTKLREKRLEKNMTQEKVCERIHVSRQTISNWENGRSYPDIISVIMLSDIYEISLDELLKGDDKMVNHLEKSTNTVKSNRNILIGFCVNIFLIVILFLVNTNFYLAMLVFGIFAVNGGILFYNFIKKI